MKFNSMASVSRQREYAWFKMTQEFGRSPIFGRDSSLLISSNHHHFHGAWYLLLKDLTPVGSFSLLNLVYSCMFSLP